MNKFQSDSLSDGTHFLIYDTRSFLLSSLQKDSAPENRKKYLMVKSEKTFNAYSEYILYTCNQKTIIWLTGKKYRPQKAEIYGL